jgi:hypothetical protein
MNKSPISFDDLDDGITARGASGLSAEAAQDRASIVNGGNATYEQITCPKCHGRGYRVYGYVNIKSYPCGVCKETGKVTAKRLANIDQAKKAEATRESNLRIAYRDWCQTEVGDWCLKNQEWNSFAASMIQAAQKFGRLSDNQTAAIERMMVKVAEKRAEKAAAKANAPEVNVSAIEALFANARASGLKRLAFRTMEIDISAAKDTGRNPGALYVKHNGEYVGKIASGKFQATYAAKPDTLDKVQAVAADPLGMARLYGKQTGNCSCCGRELTDPVSVANGIGPICESKWGL